MLRGTGVEKSSCSSVSLQNSICQVFWCAGIVARVKEHATDAVTSVLKAIDRRFCMDKVQKAFQIFQPSTWASFGDSEASERADLRRSLREELGVLKELYATPHGTIPPLVDDISLDLEWDSFEVMIESSGGKKNCRNSELDKAADTRNLLSI